MMLKITHVEIAIQNYFMVGFCSAPTIDRLLRSAPSQKIPQTREAAAGLSA
jgi:hypothetical protein